MLTYTVRFPDGSAGSVPVEDYSFEQVLSVIVPNWSDSIPPKTDYPVRFYLRENRKPVKVPRTYISAKRA